MEGLEWVVEMRRTEGVMMIMIDHEELAWEERRDFDICRDA